MGGHGRRQHEHRGPGMAFRRVKPLAQGSYHAWNSDGDMNHM